MPDKALVWLGGSRNDLRAFPATRPEAIYVLHAFEKKTQKTSARDLRIGRERFRALLKAAHGKEDRG